MGLFDRLFQSSKITICSPVAGELVPIGKVNDPVFAEEMVGKGVAVMPADGRFYAPANGEIAALFPTGHAFCILTEKGAEILIHIGLDTVKLNGEYFTIHAKQGDKVKKGELIVEVDLEGVKNAGYEIITPVMVTNPDKFAAIEKKEGAVEAGDPAIVMERIREEK